MSICGLGDKNQLSEAPPANAAPATPEKPDKDTLLNQLISIEEKIADASMNGDITFLAKAVTDDFKLTGIDGKIQDKNETLADVKKEKSIKAFSITEGELLSFTDDTAVLSYKLNLTLKNGRSGSARITDSFVKQGSKWLIKSSQQTMIRK